MEKEPRAWEGWWNEKMVELVKLSMRQKDVLSVLLTGRAEGVFDDTIKRMVGSRGLVFDMIVLKPKVGPSDEKFASTMQFKQAFLASLLETYRLAEDIRIYEDRPKHVKGFRDFMEQYNERQSGATKLPPTRKPISYDVIQVLETASNLDPVVEVAEVQHLVNAHNEVVGRGSASVTANPFSIVTRRPPRPGSLSASRLLIKKTVFFTGYLIGPADTQRLLELAPRHASLADVKFLANNILISPRPCPQSILDKIGGIGARMVWEVTGIASFQDSVWAARLRPVPEDAVYHTENQCPLVVLAVRRGARPMDASRIRDQDWVPLSADLAPLRFETTVGEKMLLSIEAENYAEDAYESLFQTTRVTAAKRKHIGTTDDRAMPTAFQQPSSLPAGPSAMMGTGGGKQRGGGFVGRAGSAQGAGRGGRSTPNRGNARGGGMMRTGGVAARGGRGSRGGTTTAYSHYRSLDEPKGGQDMSFSSMYDDSPQPANMSKAQEQQQQQQQFQPRQQYRGRQRQQQGQMHGQYKTHRQHQPQHGFYQNPVYDQQQQQPSVPVQQPPPPKGQQQQYQQQQDDQAYSMQWEESQWEQMLMRKNQQQQGGRPSGGTQGIGDDLQSFY